MKRNTSINHTRFRYKDFSSILQKYNYHLNVGDIIAGKIFEKEEHGFLVEIGTETAAYLPYEETSLHKRINNKMINDIREFFILANNKQSGQLIISIRRLEYIRAWARLRQMYNEDIILNLNITDINKGGLLVKVEGIQGFIPNSHLLNIDNRRSLLNTWLKCKFLNLDEKHNKILFSQRRAILAVHSNKLHVGQIVNSIITDIQNYGIFLRINQIPALLHISEINNNYINNIDKDFYIGKKMKVRIMHIDKQQGRLYVSNRNLH